MSPHIKDYTGYAWQALTGLRERHEWALAEKRGPSSHVP